MSPREAAWLAWYTCAISLTLTALGLIVLVLGREHPNVPLFEEWAEDAVIAVGFSTVWAIVAPRFPPQNPIGWLFCALGFVAAVLLFYGEYAAYSIVARQGSLPGGEAAAWVAAWLWVPHSGLFVFLGILFPDGRLPSPRWRPFAWAVIAVVAFGTVTAAYSPGPIDSLAPIRNPLGVRDIPDLLGPVEALVFALAMVSAGSVLARLCGGPLARNVSR